MHGKPSNNRVGQVGDWNLQVDPAVRALVVVMLDERPQGPFKVALASYKDPVKALGPCRADEAFGDRVIARLQLHPAVKVRAVS